MFVSQGWQRVSECSKSVVVDAAGIGAVFLF